MRWPRHREDHARRLAPGRVTECGTAFSIEEARDMVQEHARQWEAVVRWVAMAADAVK